MTGSLPADLLAAAALGGEMGQRVLEFDWAGHPLGDPAGWPVALRATLANALASRFPIVLWLGQPLYLVYNDSYIPVLGDKHPAALGRAGAEVWWDIWDVIGPMLRSVVATGVATWSDDLRLMLVNEGRRRERYFTFTYSPLIDPAGEVAGVFCAVTETTERVLGERRLQALNALAAALIDSKSVDEALAAAITACAGHDADLPFAAVYRPGDPGSGARLHRATPAVAGALPEELSWFLDGPGETADGVKHTTGLPARWPPLAAWLGARCPEEALVIPLGEAAGGPAAGALVLGVSRFRPLDGQYRGFCRLVADQVAAALANARAHQAERQRAESLAELDRAKTAFLTNVSHEFRTPLTLMLSPLDDVIGATGDATLTERLEMVRRNGQRLLRLVNTLLDFSRVEAGQARPDLVAADLGPLTAGIAASFAEVCQRAGIELRLDCRAAWARVDPGMWETIVLNLVSNAFKYTLRGSITVGAGTAAGGQSELTVTDTGTGIPAEHLPRLFDRFYRAPKAGGRSAEGSGIGLALVRSLVAMHAGTIEVDSAPGFGTTVRVRLPPVPADGGAPAASTAAPASTAASVGRAAAGTIGAAASAFVDEARQWLGAPGSQPDDETGGGGHDPRPDRSAQPVILVVDDNADMRRYLARVLGGRWNVLTAADGRSALDLARRYHPDLLITDVMMPGLDGFELVTAVRADPDLARLPVIMLSARAGLEAVGQGLAAGADNYLVKPFTSAELVNQVEARLQAAGRDRAPVTDDQAVRRRDLALAELGAALGDARSTQQVLESLLASPLCSLGASACALGVLDALRGQIRIDYAGAVRAEITDRYHIVDADAPVPLADVVRADRRLVVPDSHRLSERYAQIVADDNYRAGIVEPLHAEDGSVLGGLSVSWPVPREFSPADLDTLQRAARLVARAVTRIRVAEREHQLALSLQERLLDLGAGSTAAVVSAIYQSAAEPMRVGGDWYTATAVDGHRLGVSVGDVVGHGLPAAAVMSQLRSALGAATLAAGQPGPVLDLLDRYARQLPEASFATVAYAIVDAAAGTVDYACAGHLYPLIVTAGGEVRYLREGRRPPLAARAVTVPAASGHAPLPPGSLLLMYTDGLVERRAEPLDAGFARLAAAAAECAGRPVSAVCETLLRRLSPPHGYSDDVAMIAVRPVGSTRCSHVDALRATADDLKPARHRLRAWLGELGLPRAQVFNILLSVGEALCNAIEHGNQFDANRAVGLEAFAGQDAITATVTDCGRWAKDSAASSRYDQRGHGLTLLHRLSDQVQTTRTTLGTRVTLTYQRDQPALPAAGP